MLPDPLATLANPELPYDKWLAVYQRVWQKPGASLGNRVCTDMANRHLEYKHRDPNPVKTVLEKSRRLFDAGDTFYGNNCSLLTLMGEKMFARIFEAVEDGGDRRWAPEKELK